MKVSFIIPCYNSGRYLPEALRSIQAAHNTLQAIFEVVIVNDGSTDPETCTLLEDLTAAGHYTIVHQENRGVAAARNTGVRHATGEYLLFLDADNRIKPAYTDLALPILQAKKDVGVVYSRPQFFGDLDPDRYFKTIPFNIHKLLHNNFIDMCSLVRRTAFDSVNGFDEDRALMGHEDWDLWIRIYFKDWSFAFLDKRLFDYRISAQSLLGSAFSHQEFQRKIRLIQQKHSMHLYHSQGELVSLADLLEELENSPLQTLARLYYRKISRALKRRAKRILELFHIPYRRAYNPFRQ